MDRIREAKLRIYNIGDIRISGRKLDEIFDYDGVSVLWMVKEKILHDGFKLPYWNINRNLERWSSGESYGGLERLKKIAYLRAARIAIQQAMARRKGRDIKVLKADVLLFTYTNQIRTVDGKAEVFRLEGLRKGISNNLVCSILPVTMKENVRGEGVIAAEDYMTEEMRTQAMADAKKYSRLWKKHKVWELIPAHEYLRYEWDFLMSEEWLSFVFLHVRLFKKILLESGAEVSVGTIGLLDEAMHAASFITGRKSVMLQHGLLDPVMYEEMLESEHFFAFGNKQAEMVAEMQHNKNVHVTGTGIFCDRKPEKADGHGKYALLLTQPLVEDNAVSKERYFQYIRKIIGRLRDDGFEARIKMHPSEGKLDDYRKLGVEVHHAGATMKNTESLQDLIRDSCICLSFGSTAMFDAILLGKATILIEIPEYSSRIFEIENMDIPKMKIDEISFKDLRGTAAREKAAKVAQGSLRDFLHEPGKGTQNIIKKINELMKG